MGLDVVEGDMASCASCDGEFTAEELTRHDHGRLVIVHCPDCGHPLGRYRRHGDNPATDRL